MKNKTEHQRKLYVTYKEDRWGGEICEWEEDGPYACREDENIDFELHDVYTKPTDWVETVDVDFDAKEGQEVYVVVIRYYSGDTFGRTNGHWEIEGIYDNFKLADEIREAICKTNISGVDYSNNCYTDLKKKLYREMGIEKEYISCSWIGYFEGLEDCEVFVRKVKDHKPSRSTNSRRY